MFSNIKEFILIYDRPFEGLFNLNDVFLNATWKPVLTLVLIKWLTNPMLMENLTHNHYLFASLIEYVMHSKDMVYSYLKVMKS